MLLAPSGSAAIGMALKLAPLATGRHKTVSMWGAFHGANLDAISVGGEALFRKDVGPLLPGSRARPAAGIARRFFGDDDAATDRLADYIDYVLEVQGDVAAVIAEPVRWTTVEPPPPDSGQGYARAASVTARCSSSTRSPPRSGAAALGSRYERFGCVPDMVAIGKGLGGGIVPQAALIVSRDLDVVPQPPSATTRTRRARSAAPLPLPRSTSSSARASSPAPASSATASPRSLRRCAPATQP